TVHLVGAGCAGPLWITVAASRLLGRAEAVVYDSLIHPDLLQLAPQGCAFFPAGKRKGRESPGQGEINRLLVELGKTKGTVVRLKGGDPFIFGRGGEEAMALERAGVPWSYTPGITAIGGLGRAGLPPTHRGVADSLTLATGHSAEGEAPGEDLWRTMAAMDGTKAVYMGASSWEELSRRLVQNGMDPAAGCSAVTRAGWGCASRVNFRLGDPAPQIKSPALIVAGGTASLELSPEPGPLRGLRAAVVRPSPESWDTARCLEELGADGFSLPLLQAEELPFEGEEALMAEADWVILTSPRGADLLAQRADLRRLKGRVVSIGPGTTAALVRIGIRADREARPSTSEALAALMSKEVKKGELAVFFRNEAGSPLPEEAVRRKGGRAANIPAYRMNLSPPPGMESYEELWEETGLDAVVFGSAALARAWTDLGLKLPRGAMTVAWGEVCARTVREALGCSPLVLPEPTLEGLKTVLCSLVKGR
ncbi:MAG: uroporphyrinogen-III C-methyltransferase, partial [Synergistaceae bacterium]|nr:uroporphyrinogen-III C-methyltransferase [Synergistaceae bacterium]